MYKRSGLCPLFQSLNGTRCWFAQFTSCNLYNENDNTFKAAYSVTFDIFRNFLYSF